MTTRLKTVEFCAGVNTNTLGEAVNRDNAINIFIPETVVAFRSVALISYFRGDNAVADNITLVTLAIATDGTFTTQSSNNLGQPVANSGETETWQYAADVTSFFTANWSGTSNTWYARINIAGMATANHDFKLIITYEYDDTATTQIKTVRIPIESTRTSLTTTMQTIGGATAIPALTGGYLPEDSVVIRQAFLELGGSEITTAVTDYTLQLSVNGGSAIPVWRVEAGLSSGNYAMFILDITSEGFDTAKSIEMNSTFTGRGDWIGGWLTVTYEYNAATSTTILNSLVLGAIDTTGWAGGTTSADADAWGRSIMIQEPGPITLKESAVMIGLSMAGNTTINISVGDQAYTAKAMTQSSNQAGQSTFCHRIDAGGVAGAAGITLARGRNAYLCKVYSSTADDGWGMNGLLILNYTSGKATQGVGAHTQSRFAILSQSSNDNYRDQVDSKAFIIPETEYWVNGVVTESGITADNSTNGSLALQAERLSGEGEGLGWETFGITQYRADNENYFLQGRYASRKTWKRFPTDYDPDRLNLETPRSFRLDTPLLSTSWYGLWVTYHSITYTVSGSISNSAGGTVTIILARVSDGERLEEKTRVGNGAFSFTWYDNTEDVQVRAFEDATHLGMSSPGLAA